MRLAGNNYNDWDYLLHKEIIEFIANFGNELWLSVYLIRDKEPNAFTIFSALLEHRHVETALRNADWDLNIGGGLPSVCLTRRRGRKKATYHRFGIDGIRPLVIFRDFRGAWRSYHELCEEFRHFHNLAEDHQRGILLDFDDSGYEIEVARITDSEVKINRNYLRKFLAATQLYFAVYFESVRYSKIPLKDIPKQNRLVEHRDDRCCYRLSIDKCNYIHGYKTLSRLIGKFIIAPPPFEEVVRELYEDKVEAEVSFIIGVDASGKPIEYTSNPKKLSNYFGANPGAPHYLTPVYFKREVLSRYYADPKRYSVEDGLLRCLHLWALRIDNDHPTHVVVFLGDLGRDLPYNERLYWRSFNVPPPIDAGISETCFQRSFRAQFAEPKSVDLVFRQEYQQLNDAWHEKMGWPLFLELEQEDRYILQAIRIPITESPSELEQQVMWLAKLLVDSLNERELEKAIGDRFEPGLRGIQKLNLFLKEFGNKEKIVQFLRDLQQLRSTGFAHRKGSDYYKTQEKLGLAGKKPSEIVRDLLEKALIALQGLHEFLGQCGTVSEDEEL
jgi:hypothetical protein